MFLTLMKVFHPENNSRDYTGHGPMHIFIGWEAPTGRRGQEIRWEEEYGKGNEKEEKGRRRRRHQMI